MPSLTLPLYGSTLLGTISELVPSNMRGISVALYAFSGTMIGGTLGPLLTALLTEHLFHDPAKVGSSILMVAAPALCLSAGLLVLARRGMSHASHSDSEMSRVLAANEAR